MTKQDVWNETYMLYANQGAGPLLSVERATEYADNWEANQKGPTSESLTTLTATTQPNFEHYEMELWCRVFANILPALYAKGEYKEDAFDKVATAYANDAVKAFQDQFK